MKQRTLAMMTGFEQYTSKTPASHISGGDGAGGAVGRVVRAGGAALSPAWEGAAAGGSRAHAADLLFAAVVQPVGPGGGRGAVRLGGDAAVRGHRFGQRADAGRDHGVQVPALAGGTPTGGTDPGASEPALASARGANHDGHDCGRDHPARPHFHQEPGTAARSGDAPDQEGQAMVLRDEGTRGSG